MSDPTTPGLPFAEAIAALRERVPMGSESWTDLWEGMHAKAFVVAGAMEEDLVADFQGAILKALEQGTTLADFRADFDAIVGRYGWSHRGERGWRSKVVFETNLRTAYASGRWQQIQRTKERLPFLRYGAILDSRVRPEHRAWHATILPADDPWWDTHYPPNGWGCRCTVTQLSRGQAARLGGATPRPSDGPDVARTVRRNGQPIVVVTPRGIDPGWAYNPGKAAWGTTLAEEAMAAWRAAGAGAWESLGAPRNWRDLGRPERLPLDPPRAALGPATGSPAELARMLAAQLGGETAILRAPGGLRVLVSAGSLARHVPPDRAPFLTLLRETIEDPFEIWRRFERHRGTGQVVLRARFLRAVQLEKGRLLVLVANAVGGHMEAWTIVPARRIGEAARSRVGALVYGRSDGGLGEVTAGPPADG